VAIVRYFNYLSAMQELPPIFTLRQIDRYWWVGASTGDPLRREPFCCLARPSQIVSITTRRTPPAEIVKTPIKLNLYRKN
jgi:hypothetical protein